MIALKPILQAWLEEAEAQAKNKRRDPDAPSVLPAGEKKRYTQFCIGDGGRVSRGDNAGVQTERLVVDMI